MAEITNRVPKLRFPGFTDAWEQRKLGEITEISSGQNVPNEDEGTYYNLTMGSVNTEGHLVCSLHTNRTDRLLAKDMLIMPTRDVGAGYVIGRTAVIDENDKYYAGNCLYCLSTGMNEPYYIHHYMNSEAARKSMQIIVAGGSQKQITLPGIKSIEIPVCSIEEQSKIAQFFNNIDKTITLHQRKLDQMKEYKKGMLQKLFPKEGETEPEIRFPGFTGAWEQRKLKDLAESFEYGLNAAAKEYDGKNKYLRITDINDDTREFMFENLTSPDTDLFDADNYRLKEGDILFARTGASVGKSYIYKDTDGLVYYAGFLIRARVKSDYDSEFIFQNTLTSSYEKYIQITSQRSGQPGVNAQEYADYPILVPNYNEQVKIGRFLSSLDKTITLHQRKLNLMKEYKKGLLQQMFA